MDVLMVMTLCIGACGLLGLLIWAIWDQCRYKEIVDEIPSNYLLHRDNPYSLI